MKTIHRVKYTTPNCIENGMKAERLFASLAIKRGWQVTPTKALRDIKDHIDFIIRADRITFTVDVKALKKIGRHDPKEQSKYIWLELKNVRGKSGWLFGKADIIAFEMPYGFLLFKRKSLIDFKRRFVNHWKLTRDPRKAEYILYQRKGRRDVLTLVEVGLLKQTISHEAWFTEEYKWN